MDKRYNPILILTALPFESKIIFKHYNITVKPKKLTTYQLGNSIYLIEAPIGFKFDISTLNQEVEKISPKLLINFGIGGALDRTISIGSSFQIEEVCYHNKELTKIQLPMIKTAFQSVSLLTVKEPVLRMKHRDKLHSQTRCQLVDMEAFHIAQFCKAHHLQVLIIKVTSDFANEDSLDFIRANRTVLKQSLTDVHKRLITDLSL